jgi:hypothetical protein
VTRRSLRVHAPVAAAALLAAAGVLVLGSRDPFWNGDYVDEAWRSYQTLAGGGFGEFLSRAPAYTGFVTLVGAPLTLLVEHLLGGVDAHNHGLALLFRLTALPGIVALAVLGALLGARARAAAPGWAWLLVLALAAGSPIAYQALLYGHPEDVLAASLSVLGVFAARRGRPVAAGVLLALAIVSKQWAVLAVLPAMLAADGRALRIGAIACAGAAAVFVPLMLLTPAIQHASLVTSGGLFHPQQVWWPLGVPADAAFTAAGHGEVTAPAWLMPITHPLIVALALPLAALWWWRAGRAARNRDDAFALLALLFLERCALDPWNLVYYQLPLVLSLLAWEVHRRHAFPVLTLAVTAATWISFVTYDVRVGYGPFALYFAWALPLACALGWTLYGRPAPARTERRPHRVRRPARVPSPHGQLP